MLELIVAQCSCCCLIPTRLGKSYVVFITRYQLPGPKLAAYRGTERVLVMAANGIKRSLSFQTKTLPCKCNLAGRTS
jgi:hypothetical protein